MTTNSKQVNKEIKEILTSKQVKKAIKKQNILETFLFSFSLLTVAMLIFSFTY